jgi:hypothetical protein
MTTAVRSFAAAAGSAEPPSSPTRGTLEAASVGFKPSPSGKTDTLGTVVSIKGSVRLCDRSWDESDMMGLECSAKPVGVRPSRFAKYNKLLETRVIDITTLRALSWSGNPACYRVATWQMLLGYLPQNRERQSSSLTRKKAEYEQCLSQYLTNGTVGRSDGEQSLLRQILVDAPRTCPGIPLFHTEFVQRSLERVLYVWAQRHPATGYVQGINDVAMPFYGVFLSPWVGELLK